MGGFDDLFRHFAEDEDGLLLPALLLDLDLPIRRPYGRILVDLLFPFRLSCRNVLFTQTLPLASISVVNSVLFLFSFVGLALLSPLLFFLYFL